MVKRGRKIKRLANDIDEMGRDKIYYMSSPPSIQYTFTVKLEMGVHRLEQIMSWYIGSRSSMSCLRFSPLICFLIKIISKIKRLLRWTFLSKIVTFSQSSLWECSKRYSVITDVCDVFLLIQFQRSSILFFNKRRVCPTYEHSQCRQLIL